MRRIVFFQLIILFLISACGQAGIQSSTQKLETESVPTDSPSFEISLQPTQSGEQFSEPAATSAISDIPAEEFSGAIAYYSNSEGNIEIYISLAGETIRLTDHPAIDDSPAVSPDGSKIVFLSARDDPDLDTQFPRFEIYIIDVAAENLRRLTTSEASEDHPAWSPDGQKIIFDADYDGDGFYELYTTNTDGTNLVRLTSNHANDQFADWSPDGSQIAFSSDRNGSWDIFVMDVDGENQRALADSEDWELFPAWSPDGTKLAFNRLAPRSRNTDVYVMDANGADIRRLTDSPGFDENPAWSPDGSQIAFQSDRAGSFDIFVMAADGSDQQPLLASNADELWPSWGPGLEEKPSGGLLFEKSAQSFASVPTWKIMLADLDGDQDLDAVFANARSNQSQVWLNDGSGNFTDTGQQLGQSGHGIDVGDVDGDGDPDVVISTHNSTPTRVYLNDGSGNFTEHEDAFRSNIGYSIDLYDLDLDGDLDAVGEGRSEGNIFWNDGGGSFTEADLTFPLTAAWGDLDGDGDVDVFLKGSGTGYSVQKNDGQGNFVPDWEFSDPEAMEIGEIGLGDIDGDGDLDAIVTNGHHGAGPGYPAKVFFNDDTGQFVGSSQALSAVRNAGVSLGDLDGDGDLDLVLTDYQEPCQVWLNDGTGTFTDSGFRFGDDQFYAHAPLGDLDGDGDLDIFLSTFGMSEGPNEIWFNRTQEEDTR